MSKLVVRNTNPDGTITNSDLEISAILLQWIVLEHIDPIHHWSVLMRSDNTPAFLWLAWMSPKLGIAARDIVLRKHIYCQTFLVTTLHMAGKQNDLTITTRRHYCHQYIYTRLPRTNPSDTGHNFDDHYVTKFIPLIHLKENSFLIDAPIKTQMSSWRLMLPTSLKETLCFASPSNLVPLKYM